MVIDPREQYRDKSFVAPSFIEKTRYTAKSYWKTIVVIILLLSLGWIYYLIRPQGHQYTVIRSTKHNATIVYDHVLTKSEMPEYDPLVWERDKIKEYNYEVEIIDESEWDSKIYKISPLQVFAMLCFPILFVGFLGFGNVIISNVNVIECYDADGICKITKRGEIVDNNYTYSVRFHSGKKLPLINKWWLGGVKHEIQIPKWLISVRNDRMMVIKGYWQKDHVRISLEYENYRTKQLIKRNIHLESLTKLYETQLDNSYSVPEKLFDRIDDMLDGAVGIKEKITEDKERLKDMITNQMSKVILGKKSARGMRWGLEE